MFEKWRAQKEWAQNVFAWMAIVWIIVVIIWCFKLYDWYRDWTLPSEEELVQINSNVPDYWWKRDCFIAYSYRFKQRSQLHFWTDWWILTLAWRYVCSEKSSSCSQNIDYYGTENSNIRHCVTEGLSKVREVDISKIEKKNNKEDTESIVDNKKYINYTNSKFSLQYTKNWTYKENTDLYDVIFISESKNKDLFSAGAIMINSYDFPWNKEPDWWDITINMLFDYWVTSINEHSKILSKGETKINWTLAKTLLFETIEENWKKTKSEITILIKNRVSYEIIYTALTEYFDNFHKEATDIIHSLK